MDFKTVPFEIKSTSETGSEFDGFANAFHNIDSAQEIVAVGSFMDTIPQFLENGFIGNVNHQWDTPLGVPTAASEQPKGLYVEGKISATSYGKDCMILLKDRVIKKLSIGYRVLADEYLEDAKACAAYWEKAGYTPSAQDIAKSQYGARLLTKLHLFEFSPVTVPANTMADITRVKRYDTDDLISYSDIEKRLRDVGLPQKAAKIWISGLKALYQRDVEEAHTPEAEEKSEPPQDAEPDPADLPEPLPQEPEIPQPPTEAAAVVSGDLAAAKADSRVVAALYANFLTRQAKLHA